MSSSEDTYQFNHNIIAVSDDLNWTLEQLFLKSYQIENIETHEITAKNSQPQPFTIKSKSVVLKFRDGKLECNGEVIEFTSPVYEKWYPKYRRYMEYKDIQNKCRKIIRRLTE